MEPPCEHGGVLSDGFGLEIPEIALPWSRRVNTAECGIGLHGHGTFGSFNGAAV